MLRRPGAAPMTIAGVIGRTPMSMITLAITLLVVEQSGSYALAGAVTGAQAIAIAIGAPWGSRLADHWGQTRALPLLVGAHAGCIVLLLHAINSQWTVAAWIVVAAMAGACLPMMGSMVRARWSDMVEDPAKPFAWESAMDEVALIAGPVLASAIAFAWSPLWAGLVAVGLLLVGGFGLALQRGTAPASRPPRPREQSHPLRLPGMAVIAVIMLGVGAVFGGFHVSTVAFSEQTEPRWTGALLAVFSVGSLISGLWLASRTREWSLTWQVRVGLTALAGALLPMTVVARPAMFAVVAFVAGLCVAFVMAGVFALVERLVPEGRLTESLSMATAAVALGMSAGSWLGGMAIDTGGAWLGFALCAVNAAAGALVIWSRAPRLHTLERSEAAVG